VTIVLAMDIAAETPADAKKKRRFAVNLAPALTLAYAIAATTLITLHALVDELDFLSTGWPEGGPSPLL
jgi:hypothetical protein